MLLPVYMIFCPNSGPSPIFQLFVYYQSETVTNLPAFNHTEERYLRRDENLITDTLLLHPFS